ASWPSTVSGSTPSFASATSVTACKGESSTHSWDSGTVTTAANAASTGLMTYTCTKCGATEQQTIPVTVSIAACDHSVDQEAIADEGYTVTFAGDSGVDSITVYHTQDYSGLSESVSATGSTVSRSSDTGEPDSTGDGQVNFVVVLKDGYTLNDVSASGAYKNLKELGDNAYRITKITGAVTVTITTEKSETSSYILGDADGDGIVTILDATWIQRTLVGISLPSPCDEKAANVDGDGDVTIIDATLIQRWLVGIGVLYAIGDSVSA
ncbi:MAG: dockerin type I repeat-containing protein, partial [Ruminococcus sp.]|nr:dockerin type I repeat-containing protein [Ruminococcus sp.]